MADFECRLTAPATEQLLAALHQAASAARNHGSTHRAPPGPHVVSLPADPAGWRDQIAFVLAWPEGTRMWQAPLRDDHGAIVQVGFVFLAWWTDGAGSRHYRVLGHVDRGGSDPEMPLPSSRSDCLARGGAWNDGRPPLWHVQPDRVFAIVGPGGKRSWQAVCRCGVIGPPEALGWRGERCGPCHDWRDEYGSERVADPLHTTLLPVGGLIQGLAWLADGRTLACVGNVTRCMMRDAVSGAGRPLDTPLAMALAVSGDGQLLALACPGMGVCVRQAAQPARATGFSLPLDGCISVAFAPDGQTIAAGTSWSLALWSRRAATWSSRIIEPGATSLAFSPDGRWLAALGQDGLRILDPQTLDARLLDDRLHGGGDGKFAFRPDGSLLAACDRKGNRIAFWNVSTWEEHRDLALRVAHARVLAFSPDGRFLAWAAGHLWHDATVTVYDLEARAVVGELESDRYDPVWALTFSPDGTALVTGSHKGRLRLLPWQALLGVKR